MRAYPVAVIHTARCLVAWVYAHPGAVLDMGATRLELGERATKYLALVGRCRPRDPKEPEMPELPWPPPWEDTKTTPTSQNEWCVLTADGNSNCPICP